MTPPELVGVENPSGAPNAAAPKIFFRYYFVDSSTGVKSQEMLAECKWAAAAAEDPGEGD